MRCTELRLSTSRLVVAEVMKVEGGGGGGVGGGGGMSY